MVGLAKALQKDGLTTSGQDFVRELSQVPKADAEGKVHKLLRKHKLSLPIPLRGITDKPEVKGFPRLKPLDLFAYMAESGHLNKLLGGKSLQSSHGLLEDFWCKYRKVEPGFELFRPEYSDIPLGDCVPIVAHMDGGRGYKKSELMALNWGPIFGNGCGRTSVKDPSVRLFRKQTNKFHMALLGHSCTTHYLYCAMPSSWHKNNEKAFQAVIARFAEDLRECFDEGLSYGGRVLRLAPETCSIVFLLADPVIANKSPRDM